MRNLYSNDPAEVYANAFAMALLMPTNHVRSLFQMGLTVEAMADVFKVPVDVMAIRCHEVLVTS